jgi:hypothetical protein
MEITRNQFRAGNAAALALVGQGTVNNPNPIGAAGASTVDGVPYTIERTAEFVPTGVGTNPCDGGAAVTYPAVHINVAVTWPRMGAVRPVQIDSVVTPSKSLLNSNFAFVAVKVVNYAAQANVDRNVQAVGPDGTRTLQTDDTGCAVFGIANPGSYTFSLNDAGYVDFVSSPNPTKVVNVTAGSFTQVQFTYDRAGILDVTLAAPAGYALPSPLPVISLYNSSLPSPYTLTATPAASGVTQISNLGPYSNGYGVYAGGCSDANPSVSPTSGTLTNTVLAPGAERPASAVLGAVDVTGPPNTVITATHSGSCAAGATTVFTLGTTSATGALAASLPFGNWTLKRQGGNATAIFHPVPAGPTAVTVP